MIYLDNAATTLAHAVYLGDLHVIALSAEEMTQQLGGEEGALSAHAHDHNIFGIHISYLP